MAYEQIQNSLLREQEKRRMLQREMLKGSQYNPNAQVSGRSIPYSPIQGLTTLGKAWLQKKAMDDSDRRTTALNAQAEQGRNDAYGRFTDQYYGKDETLDQANMTTPQREGAQEANPVKAAMFAMQDPYLRDTGLGKAMMPVKESNRGDYVTYEDFVLQDGTTAKLGVNHRGDRKESLFWPGSGETVTQGMLRSPKDAANRGKVKSAEEKAKQDVTLEMKPQITKATDLASREAEKIIDKPKIDSTMSSQATKTGMLKGLVAKAKGQSSGWSTGLMASATDWIPASPAGKLNGTLETIKSNIGFDKLQEMRDNSPTGGALGQVSEFENKLLQAVWGNLTASVGQKQFEENLDLVEKQVEESWKRIRAAYKQDYGVEYQANEGKIDEGTVEEGKVNIKQYDDEEKERRYQEWKANQ